MMWFEHDSWETMTPDERAAVEREVDAHFTRRAVRRKELAAMSYAEYLRSREWQMRKEETAWRAGGRCQGCNSDRYLETHHRTYERVRDEDPGDLTLLCTACHTAVHLVMDARAGKLRPSSRLGVVH